MTRVLTARLLPLFALVGLLLGLGSGCAIPHLAEKMGTYHEMVAAQQAKKRLKSKERPAPMDGEGSAIAHSKYIQSLRGNPMGGGAPGKITLLPVQR